MGACRARGPGDAVARGGAARLRALDWRRQHGVSASRRRDSAGGRDRAAFV